MTQEINSIQEKAEQRYTAIRDSILSNKLTIQGQVNSRAGYTIIYQEKPVFDYHINVNLQTSYKGLKAPIQYSYSNGRSIYRFNGPSFRTPSFRTFGFSPNYKGFKLHAGNRIMDFSKFTYQNVRFDGIGIETPEKGLYCRAFMGKLRVLEPEDLIYRSNIEFHYRRKSWGTLGGYSNEKTNVRFIIFTANDIIDSSKVQDTIAIKPKENTVISYRLSRKITEKLSLNLEQSISALTHDATTSRINILTPQSAHNMFGLFERRESSSYFKASMVELQYSLSSLELAYTLEVVDKGYRSLGSLYFDNNFIENKVSATGVINEKLTYSTSIGIRNLKEKADSILKDSKLVLQSMASYRWSKQMVTYASFNNFKTVQQEYYRGLYSSSVDSLSLAQVNASFSVGANFSTVGDYPANFGAIASIQSSNSIQNENVADAVTKNRLISLTYSRQLEKSSFNASLSFVNTKAPSYQNQSYIGSVLKGWSLSDKMRISSSVQYQHLVNPNTIINQILLKSIMEYAIGPGKSIGLDLGVDLSDGNSNFRVNRFIGQLDINYKL